MARRAPKVKTFGEAIAALEQYNAQRKVGEVMANARAKCPEANYWLALAYTGGLGTESIRFDLPLDAGKGDTHLRVCVRLGHMDGILHLAAMYVSTAPVPGYDPQKAAELTELAAKCGSRIARSILQKCREHGVNLELLLSESVQLAWPSVARSLPRFPESGSAAHPAMIKQFNLDRSAWRTQRYVPPNCGVYEILSNGKIDYAHWNGQIWTLNGGVVPPGAQWRGLAYNPDLSCVTYIDPPGALLPGVTTGGYVEHYDPSSPRVRLIHVAKAIHSKDGDLLTMCGHVSQSRTPLRLWCDTLEIKKIDGDRPELCSVCASRTFETTTVYPEAALAKEADPHVQPVSDKAQLGSVDNEADGLHHQREIGLKSRPASERRESPDLPAAMTPDPSAAEAATTCRMCFAGGIGYENWDTGSTAKRFELLDKDHAAIELISKVDEPGVPPTVLLAVATRDWEHEAFTTGMVQLTTPDGNQHSYGKAAFSFTITHLDQDIVKIEGHWKDEGGPTYPFISILQRAAEPLG